MGLERQRFQKPSLRHHNQINLCGSAAARRCGHNWNLDPARGNWIGAESSVGGKVGGWLEGPFRRQVKGINHDEVVINPHVEHFKLVEHTNT